MEDKEIRKLFVAFLKEYGCLREYVHAAAEYRLHMTSISRWVNHYIKYHAHNLLISAAFEWHKQRSSKYFWSELNRLWVKFVIDNYII
jgi:hypothetical protein